MPQATAECPPISKLLTERFVHVVDSESFVCHKQHYYIAFRAGTMLHHFTFRKPDEHSRTERSGVSHEIPFQHIHAMTTRMRVLWIDYPGRITHQPDQNVRLG